MNPVAYRNTRYNYAATLAPLDGAGNPIEPVHFGIRPFLSQIVYPDNVTVQPSPGDTLHGLAYRALGNSDYFWAIADYSNILDPFTDLMEVIEYFYVGYLMVDIQAGMLTSFTMNRTKDILAGDALRLQSLDPASPQQTDVVVQAVRPGQNLIMVYSVQTAYIGTTYARVMKPAKQTRTVTIPSQNRLQFEVLDFGNPLNILDPG